MASQRTGCEMSGRISGYRASCVSRHQRAVLGTDSMVPRDEESVSWLLEIDSVPSHRWLFLVMTSNGHGVIELTTKTTAVFSAEKYTSVDENYYRFSVSLFI